MSNAVQNYVETHSKSQTAGFFLTLLFGPLGLFYSSWVAALILSAIAVATVPVGLFFCWFLAIIISFFSVSKHNEKVKAFAALGVR